MASSITGRYWDVTEYPITTTQLFDWYRGGLISGVFSRSSSYADVTGYLDFPDGWLYMNRSTTAAYAGEEGLFDVSEVSTGWDRRIIGGDPFINLLLVGSIRLREISLNLSDPASCGLNLPYCYPAPVLESSSLNETRFPNFPFTPANKSLEPTVSVSPDTFTGAGYIYDMALNETDAITDINRLETVNWIDSSTRGVFVEITYVNSRIDALITSIFVYVFDGSGTASLESVGPLVQLAQPETLSVEFSLLVAMFLTVSAFAFYILFILLKQGPIDFFSSWWNAFDIVLITLIFISIGLILDPLPNSPSTLSPVYSVIPDFFVPQIALLARSESICTYLAVVAVMLSVRFIKCLILIGEFRKMVKVFEKTTYQLFSFLPVILLAIAGISLGAYIVLNGAAVSLWHTTSSSFYATLFASVRSLPRDVFALSLTIPIAIGSIFLYVGLVIGAWVVVPGLLFGLISSVIRRYERELGEALALIEADKGALYPPGISRDSFWHRDITRIFLYSWFHRIRGYELIQETEEEVGNPDEQSIDLELLPAFIQEKWCLTRSHLIEMATSKGTTASRSFTKLGKRKSSIGMYMSAASSILTALKSGTTSMSGLFTTSIVSMKDETKISRIQLQRLLDSDPAILQTLLDNGEDNKGISAQSIRALDIIRKYKSREAVNRKLILEHLIGTESVSIRSGMSGQRGLLKAIDEIDSFYRGEVFTISETCSDLSKDLLELKSAIDGFKFKRSASRTSEISHRPIKPPR